MTRIPDVHLPTGPDGTTLTLRQETIPGQDDPVLVLRIASPATGPAIAHLTHANTRVLMATLGEHLTPPPTDSDSEIRHIADGRVDGTAPTGSDDDPWPAMPPAAYMLEPGDLDFDLAEVAFAHADRTRAQAATWLARSHCQYAAYTVAVAYPNATWITIDLSRSPDDGETYPRLVAILDPEGAPLAHEDNPGKDFPQVARQVDDAMHRALDLAPDLLGDEPRRTLHLSNYATW